MAETHLSDMIIPEVFGQYTLNTILKTNRLLTSGIVTNDPTLGPQLTQPGTKITVPFINDLDGDPDNWTDTDDIQVNSLTSGKQLALKFYQNKAFGYTDLSQLISGAPVQQVIASRFANFWNRADEKTLISILDGVFGVSTIQNSKLYDATVKSPTDSAFSAKGFIAAKGLMGDIANNTLRAIAVNSATESMMEALDLKDKITPDSQMTPFGTYKGMTIFVDDDIPVDLSDKTKPKSLAYIFMDGAVRYSTNLVDTRTNREELKNGGEESIIQKRVGTIHVAGTSVKPGFAPSKSSFPTMQELAKSSTWEVADGVDVRSIGVVKYAFSLDPTFVPGAEVAAPADSEKNQGK